MLLCEKHKALVGGGCAREPRTQHHTCRPFNARRMRRSPVHRGVLGASPAEVQSQACSGARLRCWRLASATSSTARRRLAARPRRAAGRRVRAPERRPCPGRALMHSLSTLRRRHDIFMMAQDSRLGGMPGSSTIIRSICQRVLSAGTLEYRQRPLAQRYLVCRNRLAASAPQSSRTTHWWPSSFRAVPGSRHSAASALHACRPAGISCTVLHTAYDDGLPCE